MQSFKLVEGDLTFYKGELQMISGPEEVTQCIRMTLSTNLGEWFLDPDFGIRFMAFLGKNPSDEEMHDEIRLGLSQESRIQSVDDIIITRNKEKRCLEVTFKAIATDGEQVNGEVIIDA